LAPSAVVLLLTALPAFAHNGAVAIAVPVEGIVVDGDLSDWPDLERYSIDNPSDGIQPDGKEDFLAWFRIAYSQEEEALFLAIEAEDESSVTDSSAGKPWDTRDGCEVFLEATHGDMGVRARQHCYWGREQASDGNTSTIASHREANRHVYEWRFDTSGWEVGRLRPGLRISLDVVVIDKDSDGTRSYMMWGPGAVKHFDPQRRGDLVLFGRGELVRYGVRHGLQSEIVTGVSSDRNGDLLVSTVRGAVRFRGGSFHPIAPQLAGEMVWGCIDSGDAIWFWGQGTGLWRSAQGSTRHFTTADGLPSDWIADVEVAPNGDLLFVSGGELCRYDGQGMIRAVVAKGRLPQVSRILVDGIGRLWIGTVDGLRVYEDGRLTALGSDDNLPTNGVADIAEGSSGDICVSFGGGGIAILGAEGWIRLTRDDGLPPLHLSRAVGAHDGSYWFASPSGFLTRYDGTAVQTITRRHGLPLESPADLHQGCDGTMWIATAEGLVGYRPRNTPPVISIHEVSADRPLGPVAELDVTTLQDYLVVELTGESDKNTAEDMVYVHRLLGRDSTWAATRQNRVELHDLPRGDYTLQVKAVDRDLVYSHSPAELRISVTLPYRAYGLSVSILFLSVTLAYAMLRGRRRRIERDDAREDLLREQENELQTAHDMQMGLMPAKSPDLPGVGVAGFCSTANSVGGDFYQYFEGEVRLMISLADVTGHSMEAAIPAVMFDGILHTHMETPRPMPELFQSLNRSLCHSLREHTFVCLSMVDLDPATRIMRLSNCGCPYPLHYRAGAGEIAEIEVDAYPLGVRPDTEYRDTVIPLGEGDYVVLHSDGFSEATNAEEQLFGFDRTMEVIRQGCSEGLSPEDLIERLISEVKAFTGDEPQADDMTCVVIRVEA